MLHDYFSSNPKLPPGKTGQKHLYFGDGKKSSVLKEAMLIGKWSLITQSGSCVQQLHAKIIRQGLRKNLPCKVIIKRCVLTFLGEHSQEEELAGAPVAPQILPLEEDTCSPQQLLRPALQHRQGRQKGSFHETTLITTTKSGSPWMSTQDVSQPGREWSQKWWGWQLDMSSCIRVMGEYGQDTDLSMANLSVKPPVKNKKSKVITLV